MKKRWWYACALCAALVACGGDDDGEGTPDAGDNAGSGGAAGMTAGTGGGGSGGSAGMMSPGPVECGTTMCQQPTSPLDAITGGMMLPIPLPRPMACCVDEAAGECGLMPMANATCESLAEEDERCPDIDLGALGGLGMGGFGCCTPAGQCGVDGAAFGRGCVENGEARAMLEAVPFIGTLFMIPDAQACDAIGDDAGMGDDGGT